VISNKSTGLLFFLLCFCFVSTSYADTCLLETEILAETYNQFELEDNHEPEVSLSRFIHFTAFEKTSVVIAYSPTKYLKLNRLPYCNRDPPLSLRPPKQHPIL
jgi:hypothetical protein